MSVVRQAHLPGNYELYDPSSNALGPSLCKGCWEEAGVRNTESLQSVWVAVEGSRMVWWLCSGHADAMKTNPGGMKLLRSEAGVVLSPRI
ncbi:MAG TPA: hypothetical protein VKF15_00685 [Nitrososphaerales archaeon]|nr:hypothetical protein [Nitrososphaerales archaeon]